LEGRLRTYIIVVVFLALLLPSCLELVSRPLRSEAFNPWPWARPGAYAVYTPVPAEIDVPDQVRKRWVKVNATINLRWVVVDVTPQGLLVNVTFEVPEIKYSTSKLFLVTFDGYFYDAETGECLGVWTFFRPPHTLIPGSKVPLAVKAPVAAAGPVEVEVLRPTPYDWFKTPRWSLLRVDGYVLVALRYRLALERIVRLDATTKYLKAMGDPEEVAEKIARAVAERYPQINSMILNDLPFVEGFKKYLLDGYLNVNYPPWGLCTANSYDLITGLAVSISVFVDFIDVVLSDDTMTAIGLPQFEYDYSAFARKRYFWLSEMAKLFGLSEEDVVKALGISEGYDEARINAHCFGLPSLLMDTNVFDLMSEAVAGGAEGTGTQTAATATTATSIPTSTATTTATTLQPPSPAETTTTAPQTTSTTPPNQTAQLPASTPTVTTTAPTAVATTQREAAPAQTASPSPTTRSPGAQQPSPKPAPSHVPVIAAVMLIVAGAAIYILGRARGSA